MSKLSKDQYAKLKNIVWRDSECENARTGDQTRKLFERSVDDIVCKVKYDPNTLLRLDYNLQEI